MNCGKTYQNSEMKWETYLAFELLNMRCFIQEIKAKTNEKCPSSDTFRWKCWSNSVARLSLKGDYCTTIPLRTFALVSARWGSGGNKCKNGYSNFLMLLIVVCIYNVYRIFFKCSSDRGCQVSELHN